MWSWFEDLDTKNTMLQSEFNLHISSGIYGVFLVSNKFACGWCQRFVLSYTYIFPLRTQTVRLIGLKCGPPRVEPLLQAMVGRCITLSDKQSRPIAPPAPINNFFYSEILFKWKYVAKHIKKMWNFYHKPILTSRTWKKYQNHISAYIMVKSVKP